MQLIKDLSSYFTSLFDILFITFKYKVFLSTFEMLFF